MKKSDYTGWKEVFLFSLVQGMKEKVYYGFLIFISIAMILSQPVASFIQNLKGEEEAYRSKVTSLTVYDLTDLGIDYGKALSGEEFEGIVLDQKYGQEAFMKHVNRFRVLKKGDNAGESKELIVRVTFEEGKFFNLIFVKPTYTALKDSDCKKVMEAFEEHFDKVRRTAVEMDAEQVAELNREVETKVEFITESGEILPEEKKTEAIPMEEYTLLLLGIMVVMMVINLAGGTIMVSITIEKSTRVVEYLMINIRPMALIVGKILSSLVLVIIQLAVMGCSYLISSLLSLLLFGEKRVTADSIAASSNMDVANIMETLSQISLGDILVALIVIACGIMLFCILAGLAGASVSKMEELGEGMKLYQLILMGGTYLGIGMCISLISGGDNQAFVYICSLLPISAPFVVPASLLLGKIPMWIALISVGIMLVLVAGLFVFTARVYESMILYNGSVLKLKDIIQIAKTNSKSQRVEGGQNE